MLRRGLLVWFDIGREEAHGGGEADLRTSQLFGQLERRGLTLPLQPLRHFGRVLVGYSTIIAGRQVGR